MLFREKLAKQRDVAEAIMKDKETNISQRYKKVQKLIYKAAMESIGKTTISKKFKPRPTKEMKRLRQERKVLKKDFEKETNEDLKGVKLNRYVKKQIEIKELAKVEEQEATEARFERMMKRGPNGLWDERKRMRKDNTGEWGIVKNEEGERIYDPEEVKKVNARHYENLYGRKPVPHHDYHDHVEQQIPILSSETFENREIDQMPTKKEIEEAIKNKKNKKATTDWDNEILKRGGEPMVDILTPVIRAFWEEGIPPDIWNQGIITNVFKGKGDREDMANQRGITVSSSIGTIVEEILTNRLLKTIKFSQAQAGGRKGGNALDHIFILKSKIEEALKEGQDLIITFFDIKKAYDRADMDDMLFIINKEGFNGKVWNLAKSLNKNLTARVKTKAGLTDVIKREKGGKQGAKLMVPMFSKMMDKLPESMHENAELGVPLGKDKIASLAFVDDIVSLAMGYAQQEKTLCAVNEFSIIHQLEWGENKCKVMEIGNHKEAKTHWNLGDKTIECCSEYKYLGEVISRNGKNTANLKEKMGKFKGSVIESMSCAKNEVMKRIQTSIMLKYHEAVTLPTLLYGCETWNLNASEMKQLERVELWALKKMFGLPPTTPNAAMRYATGTHFMEVRIQLKQILFLHHLLQRENRHWARGALFNSQTKNFGWAKNIEKILTLWEINDDWEVIAATSKNAWKVKVMKAAEKRHKSILLEECQTKTRGTVKCKTKTKTIFEKLQCNDYKRTPILILRHLNCIETRAFIMGRFGMLDCKANFSNGYGGKVCDQCGMDDNEEHRMNECVKYRGTNNCDDPVKIPFNDIYSDEIEKVKPVLMSILKIWDLTNGKNRMRIA